MKSIINTFRSLIAGLTRKARALGRWYLRRGIISKILIAGAVLALIVFGFPSDDEATQPLTSGEGRFVTLATVQELSGMDGNAQIIGTVRAVTGAEVLAQTGGIVTSVNTKIGNTVRAGTVIVNLENAAERAAVLSAEGAYEAALAARDVQSLDDTEKDARDAYRSAYTLLELVLENDLSVFFGSPTVYGPKFLLDGATLEEQSEYSRERKRLDDELAELQADQQTAAQRDPEALLNEAESFARDVQAFLNRLSILINEPGSTPTTEQTDNLASARTSINTVLSQIGNARAGLRSGTIGATAGADASVKQALGALRAAQANLERTIVRAPVSGRIDFLPVRVGDYVTALQHVASISGGGTLEVVAYVSENERTLLTVGESVTIDDVHTGVITSVSPALDPVTKQIEVRVAVEGTEGLVGGQSVRVTLPVADTITPEEGSQNLLLPLASVKLRADDRIVFSVNAEGRLEAHSVVVGDVHGDRIEIRSDLSPDLRIVTDARGLAEGELVRVSEQND